MEYYAIHSKQQRHKNLIIQKENFFLPFEALIVSFDRYWLVSFLHYFNEYNKEVTAFTEAPLASTIELEFTKWRPAKRSQMLFLAGNTNKALCSAATLAVLDALDAITSRCRRPKLKDRWRKQRKFERRIRKRNHAFGHESIRVLKTAFHH